jgi:hypothetical protein
MTPAIFARNGNAFLTKTPFWRPWPVQMLDPATVYRIQEMLTTVYQILIKLTSLGEKENRTVGKLDAGSEN